MYAKAFMFMTVVGLQAILMYVATRIVRCI